MKSCSMHGVYLNKQAGEGISGQVVGLQLNLTMTSYKNFHKIQDGLQCLKKV